MGMTLLMTACEGTAGIAPGREVMDVAGPCFANGCHAELKRVEQPYKHRPYADERCRDCHTLFHTGQTQFQYGQNEMDLCYACHPQTALGATHPVGEGVVDRHTGRTMTCTSSCHLSHSAPYPYLLALPGEGALCVSCHEDFVGK